MVDYILQIDLFFVYRTVLSDVIVVLFEKQRAALETKSQWSLQLYWGPVRLAYRKKGRKREKWHRKIGIKRN